MLIKVCGMKSEEQVNEIDGIVDFIGFIFFEGSKRFVKTTPSVQNAQKVGVFVNTSIETIVDHIKKHHLDFIQLHGDESPEMCSILKNYTMVIRAFGVDELFDFTETEAYADHVDYFLFDTKTRTHGGSGKRFDWSLLSNYQGSTPFFLSGGIHLESIESLKKTNHPKLAGIDVNSGFEYAPADKNIIKLKQFIQELRQ